MPDPTRAPAGPPGRGFLRRHALLITATTVLVALGAFGYASLATPVYTAHARVLVEPLTLPTAVQREPDMGTEAAVATSSSVLTAAAGALHLSLNTVNDAVGVSVPPNANVLDIAYSSTDPMVARNGATSVAAAYMAYRARTTNRLAANRLAAPGVQTRLVTPAARPAEPSSPDVVVDVLAGLVVGLVAAGALAFVADRFGRRIRGMARWQEIAGVPVVAGLRTPARGDAAASVSANAAAVRYLRMRTGQVLPAGSAVLAVVTVSEQPDAPDVARRLAGAFVDVGRCAVLIEMTRDRERTAVGATTQPADLSVRVTLPGPPGHGLRPAGEWHPTTAADLLTIIDRHRAGFGLVIVGTPPTATSVTALDVAAVADCALIVDHCGTARRDAATREVAQLRGVDCRVAGAVLLGLRTTRFGDGTPIAASPAATGRPRPRPGHTVTQFEIGRLDRAPVGVAPTTAAAPATAAPPPPPAATPTDTTTTTTTAATPTTTAPTATAAPTPPAAPEPVNGR